MFRDLVVALGGNAFNNANDVLTTYTPLQLANYLEMVWAAPRALTRQWRLPSVQPPATVGSLTFHRAMARNGRAEIFAPLAPDDPSAPGAPPITWAHLVYAYMVESTGIAEIFRRILRAWIEGETLPFPSLETQYWIRASEELFFKSPSPYFHSLASDIRPDAADNRRLAYERLLGMRLGHDFGNGNGKVPRRAPAIANTEFVSTFERLLHEVWNGFVYRFPGAGPNAADFQAMLQLVRELREMLLARRTNGSLLREEFEAVSMMSWFHLTVEHDTHIVNNLNAQSTSAASRLARIGSLVGLAPAPAADSYFQLADAMSMALILIEDGVVEGALLNNIPVLSDPRPVAQGGGGPLAGVMQTIITHWPTITGRPVKGPVSTVIAYPVTTVPGLPPAVSAQPTFPPMVVAPVSPASRPNVVATNIPAVAIAAPPPQAVTVLPSFVGVNRVSVRVETKNVS